MNDMSALSWKCGSHVGEGILLGKPLAIRKESESPALSVMFACAIPENSYAVAVVRDGIKAKPVPGGGWQEGEDLNDIVTAGLEADEAGDQQIGEGGMIVIAAAPVFPLEPLASRFIEVLADVRFAVEMLAVDV